jgi:hypothetical protein
MYAARLDTDLDRLVAEATGYAALIGPGRPAPGLHLRLEATLPTEFEIGLEVRPSAQMHGRPFVGSATCIPHGDATAVHDAITWFRERRTRPDRAAVDWAGATVGYTPLWEPAFRRSYLLQALQEQRSQEAAISRRKDDVRATLAPPTIELRARSILDLFVGASAVGVSCAKGECVEEALLFESGPRVSLAVGYPDGLRIRALLAEQDAPGALHEQIWGRVRGEAATLAARLGVPIWA